MTPEQALAQQLALAKQQTSAAWIQAWASVGQACGAIAAIITSVILAVQSSRREARTRSSAERREIAANEAAELRAKAAEAAAAERWRAEAAHAQDRERRLSLRAIDGALACVDRLIGEVGNLVTPQASFPGMSLTLSAQMTFGRERQRLEALYVDADALPEVVAAIQAAAVEASNSELDSEQENLPRSARAKLVGLKTVRGRLSELRVTLSQPDDQSEAQR